MKPIPVAEIFGPTIQGEGLDAGLPCYFVRTGGCDFSCSWCDSLHAVLPERVRNLGRSDEIAIIARLVELGLEPGDMVVLSGGNPALHDLFALVDRLHAFGVKVSVETQGTRWKPWLNDVDTLIVSPKPPSSGMAQTPQDVFDFFACVDLTSNVAIKVVVGDDADYEFAAAVHARLPGVPFFMSVLNDAGSDVDGFSLAGVLARYRWLCEKVAADKRMQRARVMPQLHTLAWGSEMGR